MGAKLNVLFVFKFQIIKIAKLKGTGIHLILNSVNQTNAYLNGFTVYDVSIRDQQMNKKTALATFSISSKEKQ